MELRKYTAKGNIEQIGERTYRTIISDESVDRHMTVIKADGWSFDNFMRNPIITVQHDAYSDNMDTVVGKALRVWQDDNRTTWMDFELEPAEINPLAEKIDKKIKFGSIRAFSVGFNPFKWSEGDRSFDENPNVIYFRKQDLLEVGIVKLPSNPNATPTRATEDYEEFVSMIRTDLKMDELSPITEETSNEITPINPDVTEYLRLRVR